MIQQQHSAAASVTPTARSRKLRLVAGIGLALALSVQPIAHAATHAKKKPVKKTRTVTYQYQNPCAANLAVGTPYYCPSEDDVTVSSKERYVSFSAVDATGKPVPFFFSNSAPGVNAGPTPSAYYCGSAKDVTVHPGTTVQLYPAVDAPQVTDCPNAATQGTVTIVLSNLP